MHAACLTKSKANLSPIKEWSFGRKSQIARSLAFAEERWKTKEKKIITIPAALIDQDKKAKARINELCADQNFNEEVKNLALQTLNLCLQARIMPSLINSTGESLLFEFFKGKKSFSLDFYNSGEIVYLRRSEGEQTFVAEIKSSQIKEVVSRIATN